MIGSIILAHLVGDYILQTDYMAQEKTRRWTPAILHGITYTLPFLFITQSPVALLIICVTHIIIDRFRLAKYLVYLKNQIAPKRFRYKFGESSSGYAKTVPDWMGVWLMIVADNTLHLLINVWAVYTF